MIHLEEAFENALGIARRQSDAVVLDHEQDAAVLSAGAQGDLLLLAGVFEGVVQQVHHGGHQRIGIGHYGWQAGGDMGLELAAGGVEAFAHRRDGPFDNGRGGHLLEPERILIPFHAGEGQEVVNQTAQAQVFPGDELQVFAGGFLVNDGGAQEGVHQQAHGGQGCFEFVGDVGDQVVAQLRHGCLAFCASAAVCKRLCWRTEGAICQPGRVGPAATAYWPADWPGGARMKLVPSNFRKAPVSNNSVSRPLLAPICQTPGNAAGRNTVAAG